MYKSDAHSQISCTCTPEYTLADFCTITNLRKPIIQMVVQFQYFPHTFAKKNNTPIVNLWSCGVWGVAEVMGIKDS